MHLLGRDSAASKPTPAIMAGAMVAALFLVVSSTASAGVGHEHGSEPAPKQRPAQGALESTAIELPTFAELIEVLTLQNYNTRLVVVSTALLGMASGLIGSFLLLRKRSLMGDALSHATLPGIALAFMVMVALGMSGKALPGLLLGATITGVAGVGLVLAIRNTSRIKDDAAMGIVLSVFFGLGVALLRMGQSMPQGSAAGLESFIYGKTASMIWDDFLLIAAVAGCVALLSIVLFKEFTVLCFDEGYASSLGWPVNTLDMVMLGLVAAVTVVGLQAVGLILIIAFLVTPAAAARFWTNDLRTMLILAGLIGAGSGWLGASLSALLDNLPAGAVIVLVTATVFLISMFLGPARGVVRRWHVHRRLKRKVGRQHLLRAAFELLEDLHEATMHRKGETPGDASPIQNVPIAFDELVNHRTWTPARVRRLIRMAGREDHVEAFDGKTLRLSESGFGEAARITRNHRLWEMYLIQHADVAPSHVDRDADAVEHVLGPEMVRMLEAELAKRGDLLTVPPSPHMVRT